MPNIKARVVARADAARPRLAALRARFEDRAFLATTPGTVNWLTGGLSDPIDVTSGSDPVWVLEHDGGRVLITTEIEAPRLLGDFRGEELAGDVVGVPWFEPEGFARVASEITGVPLERLLSDTDAVGENVHVEVVAARLALSLPEQEDLRELAAIAAHALEDALDAWRPGVSTDFDVASAISADLVRHGVTPVCLIVGGDERLRRYRHPLAVGEALSEAVMAVVVARRGGLHAAATRLALRRGDPIVALIDELDEVNRRVVEASAPGRTWGEAVCELELAYEKIGHGGAWREHYQGGPLAFEQREFELAPSQSTSPFWSLPCVPGTAFAWNPSLRGGAKIEETYLLGADGAELITVGEWPLTSKDEGPARSQVKVLQ